MSDLTFWGKASVEEARAEIARGTSLEAGGDGRSPLHEAAAYNTVGVVRLLVEKGLEVKAQDTSADTPLHFAAEYNPDHEVVRLLLDHGADVNAKNRLDETPLHKAAEFNTYGTLVVARALLERGADVNAKNKHGKTPLHIAAESNDAPGVVRALLEHGADKGTRNDEGQTACWLAVSRGADEEIRRLLCLPSDLVAERA